MANERGDVSTEVGTRMLFENERIRVWEMTLEPGERSHRHRHLHDHFLIYADASEMRGYLDGADEDQVVQDVDVGWVAYREVGREGSEAHQLENIGSSSSRHFIVELLGGSVSEEAQPPVVNELGRFEFPGSVSGSDSGG